MSHSVIVIEDNRDLADNIRELLDELEAETTVSYHPRDAAQQLAKRTFDLAIIDLNLPDGNGVDLVPAVKESSPYAEVVLITGDATLGSAIEAVRQGVFAYVQKPFDPSELLTLAERALAQVTLKREREELSIELARSEALYHDVVDSVRSLLVGLDQRHRVRMWNRRLVDLTGVSADEALGQPASELLVAPEHRAAFDDALEEGHGRELTLPLRTPSDAPRIVRWRLTGLTGISDALALAVGEDVTDAMALEARAADAEAMAALGRMTAGLAHEIRNPLNAASLQLEIMARTASRLEDERAREQLIGRGAVVRAELTRLTRLLDEFLGLARPQAVALGSLAPGELLEAVAAAHDPLARQAGLTLSVVTEPGLPPVRGDTARLKQALVNLVVNAIDAMRERARGTVRLVARSAGEEVELRVEDDGPGLPELARHELFRAFVTTKERGTGLGLAMVKQIVEQHGGRIELEPREGGGTVACVRLQRCDGRSGRERDA